MEKTKNNPPKWLHRILALAAATLFLLVLLLPRLLTPALQGVGTHHQLGLKPCSALVYLGIPCPGCGGTTSFAHMARGNLPRALRANVFGSLLYLFLALWSVDLTLLFLFGHAKLTPWLLENALLAIKIALGLLVFGWLVKMTLWCIL